MQMLLRRGNAVLIFVAVMLLWIATPASLTAQDSSGGSIAGTVTDPYGRAVAQAAITITDQASKFEHHMTSDDQGRFTVAKLPSGIYDVTISASGFALLTRSVQISSDQTQTLSAQLKIGPAATNVEVQAIAGNSIAAQHALSQGTLDTVAPKSEISSEFIREFTPPTTDYSEIINIAPGTFSYNSNGVGLGEGSNVFFRGFIDGDYDITWDGIPFEDTNNPTHHAWAFFPGVWIGGVDFDRSPGTASTIGPATYGGSINLLSKEVPQEQSAQGEVSYGSFNTLLLDGQYSPNAFGPGKKISLAVDVHRMTSDGFETLNDQTRVGGDIKVLYNLSDRTTITGFSGVIRLNNNTPNNSPYRAQIQAYGWNYLLENNDPTSAFYQKYNTYAVPTDFEYVGVRSQLKHGWLLDLKPYTYSYYNAQYYANDSGNDTTGLATGPNGSSGQITEALCEPSAQDGGKKWPCAVDKLNSYRKYGETATVSQVSKLGVFRTGMWYEWATTNRYQIPSDPILHVDQTIPNFHEQFYTNSYNPFAEYEWHATKKLTITAGDKYAYYTMALTQYADNGHIVGNLGGAASVSSSGGSGSNLPSADVNYRLTPNWSIYGQFGKGAEIPPSSLYDVPGGGANVPTQAKPQMTTTYQGGTVLKLNRFTLDADYYRVKFQNNYIPLAVANPNNPNYDLNLYYLGPDSVTNGFEAEANAYLGHGLNVYASGTAGKATYTGSGVPSNLYVADTPAYTQGLAVTYQAHGFDLGVVEKRVGDHYDDNGTYHNQVYNAPFNNANLFLNYTIRNHSIFNESKIRFSVNNLFNDESVLDVAPSNSPQQVGNSVYFATTAISPLDQLNLTAGRSFMVSFKVGIFPNRSR